MDLFSGTTMVAVEAFASVTDVNRVESVGETLPVVPGEQPALKDKSSPIRRKIRTNGDVIIWSQTAYFNHP